MKQEMEPAGGSERLGKGCRGLRQVRDPMTHGLECQGKGFVLGLPLALTRRHPRLFVLLALRVVLVL